MKYLHNVLGALLLATASGCSSTRNAAVPDGAAGGEDMGAVTVLPGVCPSLEGEGLRKIHHADLLRSVGARAERIVVWLAEPRWPELPSCPDASDDERALGCEVRDDALEERSAINVQQLDCILADALNLHTPDDVSRAIGTGALDPVYWQEAFHFGSGHPLPIMQAFEANATWALVQQLARHPYVARIEPPFGQVPFLNGVAAPPPPADCPTAREDVGDKLAQAATLTAGERHGVVIALRLDDLPEQADCPTQGMLCEAWTHAEHERYLIGKRRVACVLRELDAVVRAEPPEPRVSFASLIGSARTEPIAPWQTRVGVLAEVGRSLLRDEAEALATHPYVSSVRVQELSEDLPEPGCPLDTSAPVPSPSCDGLTEEPSTGKWTSEDEATFELAGVHDVLVQVHRGANVCPLPTCPSAPNACAELTEAQAYLMEWNEASQTCVRARIAQLGGVTTDEQFWLVNAIVARLDWAQIQALGAHPHVATIQSATDGAPPP